MALIAAVWLGTEGQRERQRRRNSQLGWPRFHAPTYLTTAISARLGRRHGVTARYQPRRPKMSQARRRNDRRSTHWPRWTGTWDTLRAT